MPSCSPFRSRSVVGRSPGQTGGRRWRSRRSPGEVPCYNESEITNLEACIYLQWIQPYSFPAGMSIVLDPTFPRENGRAAARFRPNRGSALASVGQHPDSRASSARESRESWVETGEKVGEEETMPRWIVPS